MDKTKNGAVTTSGAAKTNNTTGATGTTDTPWTALREINAQHYGLDTVELIVANMVQVYLGDMAALEALRRINTVIGEMIIDIPAADDKDGSVVIHGQEFAALIDEATEAAIEYVKKEIPGGDLGSVDDPSGSIEPNSLAEDPDIVEIKQIILKMLASIDGKKIVRNISPEFLWFLADCREGLEELCDDSHSGGDSHGRGPQGA